MKIFRFLSSLSSINEPENSAPPTNERTAQSNPEPERKSAETIPEFNEENTIFLTSGNLRPGRSVTIYTSNGEVLYRLFLVSGIHDYYENVLYIEDILEDKRYFAYKRKRFLGTYIPDVVITPMHDRIYEKPLPGDIIIRTNKKTQKCKVFEHINDKETNTLVKFGYSKQDEVFDRIVMKNNFKNENMAFLTAFTRHIVLNMPFPNRIWEFYLYWTCSVPQCQLGVRAVLDPKRGVLLREKRGQL